MNDGVYDTRCFYAVGGRFDIANFVSTIKKFALFISGVDYICINVYFSNTSLLM